MKTVSAFPTRLVRRAGGLALLLALAACSGGKTDAPKDAPKATASAAASAPASEAAKAGGPLGDLIEKAVACVEKGRVNRGCDGYAQLSQAVNTQRRDPEVVRSLLTAMESDDAARKALALTLLARPFPEEADAAARLLKRLETETDANLKADILEALATRNAPGVDEAALKLLQAADAEPGIRAAAARLLGSKPHEGIAEQSKPALLKALREDQAPAVRRNAATALGNLQHAEALPDLIKALDDQLVAPSATFALARFETPEAYDAIWSRIEAATKDDAKVSLPLLASIRLLEKHPKHDAKKALKTLEKLKKVLEKRAAANDGTAQAALKLIERNIDRLSGKTPDVTALPGVASGAAPKTPTPAPKSAPANK
ncbi:HEAT repeat domain-containing protein [Myxococcota bacterium]|nr:HEAT repeat domain-containing protein [Myxococcota bacterium]